MLTQIMVGWGAFGLPQRGGILRPLSLLLFLSLVLSNPLHALFNNRGDYQIWIHNSATGHINPHYGIHICQEYRLGGSAKKLYQQYSEILLQYYASPHFILAPGYKQLYDRRPHEQSTWNTVAIPEIDLKLRAQNQYWNIEYRNRLEYSMFSRSDAHDGWVYRGRLTVDTPFYYKNPKLRIYLMEEFFYGEGRGLFQNRLRGGIKMYAHKTVQFNAAYMLRNLKLWNKTWVYNDILYLAAEFHF